MHIFCDESGGCTRDHPCFLAVGVLIEPQQADRVITRFRKKIGLKGEVHGHELTDQQHAIFFDYLGRYAAGGVAAAVVCRRAEQIGG